MCRHREHRGPDRACHGRLAQCGAGRDGGAVRQRQHHQYDPQGASGQLSQLTGGNTELKPETSNSWTAGLTFTPEQVPGLTGSIDYFHIAIDGEVSTHPAAVIMSKCLADSDPVYCSQIVRNAATGSLTGATIAGGGYFIQTNVNVGAALVSGVDVQANYHLALGTSARSALPSMAPTCSTSSPRRCPGSTPTTAPACSAPPARP